MHSLRSSVLLVLLLGLAPLAEAAKPTATAAKPGSREERIQWWREARFGMFIHWGLYAVPGGTWKDKVHKSGYSEWMMFSEKIHTNEYAQLAQRFNPVKFDAGSWVTIAKQAGMKYMVLTTKHHDGFSMFQSDLTTYDIVDATPFKRDVTRELSEACRKDGIRFGCYYSIDRDWFRPQGPGNRYKQNNVWDFPNSTPEDFNRYVATFAKPQVEELLTRYKPDLLWFDEIDMKSDEQVADLYQTIRRLRPSCVINSRIQGCRFPTKIPPPHCDYITSGDNEILKQDIGFEWENPGSMNTSYGYNQNDHQWVDAGEIIFRLVDIVSKGGNYLLNVGPTAEGLIPQPSVDRLREVGDWLAINGEAIYGTSPWKAFREGPDHASQKRGPSKAPELRFTSKGDLLYLICLDWPGQELLVKALAESGTTSHPIASVRMLGSKEAITWGQRNDGLALSVPRQKPCSHAQVYEISFKKL